MSERAQEVLELYEEGIAQFKKAIITLGLSFLAALGAVFYFKKKRS